MIQALFCFYSFRIPKKWINLSVRLCSNNHYTVSTGKYPGGFQVCACMCVCVCVCVCVRRHGCRWGEWGLAQDDMYDTAGYRQQTPTMYCLVGCNCYRLCHRRYGTLMASWSHPLCLKFFYVRGELQGIPLIDILPEFTQFSLWSLVSSGIVKS